MGFWDEYNKALLDDTPEKSSGGSGSSGGAGNYWSEYNKVISSGPVATPAIYRPGVNARSRITLPLRPGTTKPKITTLPYRSGSGSYERITLPNVVGKDDEQTDAPIRDKVDSRLTVDNKKDEEEDKDKKWYQKGHFEDGYDFGDLTKTILGIDDDTASLKDLTINSAKRGYYNSLYGEETFKEIFGEENQSDVYKEKLESDEYQFAPGNDLASGISGAFEQIGQQFRQFTNPRTIGLTGTAAIGAVIAGNAGPQALVPEEVISVPAAAIAGFKTGSAMSNLEIEAGHAYNEMLEAGISEETAKKVALGVGSVNAGLELLQVDELVDAFKVTKKSGATKTVSKKILEELKNRGIDIAKETAQEVAQEGVTIAGTQAASKLDKGEFAYNADDVKNRLWDTAKSSALTFGMMNVPATAKNTYSIIKDSKNTPVNQTVQNEHPIEEQIPKVEQETKPEAEEVKQTKADTTVSEYVEAEKVLYSNLRERFDELNKKKSLTEQEYDELDNIRAEIGKIELFFEGNGIEIPIVAENTTAPATEDFSAPEVAIAENEKTTPTASDAENFAPVAETEATTEKFSAPEVSASDETYAPVSETLAATSEPTENSVPGNNKLIDRRESYYHRLVDELKSLQDNLDSQTNAKSYKQVFDKQRKRMSELKKQIAAYERIRSQEESSRPDYVAPVTGQPTTPTISEKETVENTEVENLRDQRQVLQDTIMSRVEVNQVDETTEMLVKKWHSVNNQIQSMEPEETMSDASAQSDSTNNDYIRRLREEFQSLKDNLDAQPDYASFRATLDSQRGRMEQLKHAIEAFENLDSKDKVTEASENAANQVAPEIDPSTFSEQIGTVIGEMLAEDSSTKKTAESEKVKHYVVGDFHIVRRLSPDGERYVFNVTYEEFHRTGTADRDDGEFYSHVANALDSILHESVGMQKPLYDHDTSANTVMRSGAAKNAENQPVIVKKPAVPADAPIRVVATEDGGFLETGEWQNQNKSIPRQPKVLTEQPPTQKQQANGKKTDGKDTDNATPKKSDTLDVESKKLSPLKWIGEYVADHGFWVERLSKKTGNRELDARWNFIRYARGGAQHLIGKGYEANGVKSLKSMLDRVDKAGLTQDFYTYMHHWLNYDRMTVEDRYPNSQNRGVFGQAFNAEDSLAIVQKYEQAHPEFKEWAEDVYAYNRFLRNKLVDAGVITRRTADLWEEMFPHYVPIRRSSFNEVEYEGPKRRSAGFNSSVHEFEGSDKDILPLFDTMSQRTLEVYRAAAMNGFASELYNTLYPGYANNGKGVDVPVDYFLDSFDPGEELLESGELGSLPTLSFYKNGKRHTFDITSEMYESLKPASDWLSYKVPVLSEFSNLRRALITEYNPWFVLKNAVKDVQDIVINSQHPLATYANLVSKAPMEMATNGQYYQEYLANGGNQNTYFDKENVSFDTESGLAAILKKYTGLEAISKANNIVEMLPRLSEYIASREAGRSVEESMLDASRVTTNFAAGGKLTKLLNRNGATFLNASVQGFMQQARNIVEAKQNGLKGWASLAARYAAVGIPAFVLNNLVWDDDEEYKELPDYITNNYYIVGKYGDGKFVRIPKGRTAAVIQNAIEQVANMSSGDDEADWNEFFKLFAENIAPNNPLEDNVFAPIGQVATNKTWYGEDLVPNRLKVNRDEDGNLKEVPTVEQHDEKTDSISIWLSEKLQGIPGLKNLELSPKQINYLLDQYSGVVGDTVLPFFTPKAESPNDSFVGKAISPLRDIFTTDSVLNNRVTGDFYDTLEAAEAKAESENATMSDKLRSGILISANVDVSKLLKEQRKIQTSDLPDSEKYQKNRELKEKINALQKDALDSLNTVFTDGIYAEAGDKRYNYSEEDDTWWEVKPELADGKENWYYIQEQLSHDKLGMSYADFWNGRKPPEDFEGKTYYAEYNGKRYNYDVEDNYWYEIKPKTKDGEDNYFYQQEQIAHDKLGVSYEDFWNNREAYIDANYVADRWGEPFYETVKNVFGSEHFAEIASGMADISADKDKNGNPISGSRKRKIEDYIYSLDIPEVEKYILFKSQYSYTNKHNYKIINYLNEREDISYEEMESVLTELGFKVDKNGRITW